MRRSRFRRVWFPERLEARRVLDSTVMFNEIMYNPAGTDETLEWVELHNQMAVDMDVSKWSLEGGVDFTFAEGTIIPGGGHLVVAGNPAALAAATGYSLALGPYAGVLDNNGEELRLVDRNDRLMDVVDYRDEGGWPSAADGSGASLAKVKPNSASGPAENWASSVAIGGTLGRGNFPQPGAAPVPRTLVELDQSWRFEASGTDLGAAWRASGFDDSTWDGEATARLISYWPLNGNATAVRGTNGTLLGGPTATADRNGVAGGALAFNGTLSQHVSVEGGGGLSGASAGTISLWVKWTGNQDAACCGGAFGSVLARQANGLFSDNVLSLNGVSPGTARLQWQQENAGPPIITGTTVVGNDVWRHIAVRFSSAGTEIFLNGVSQGTAVGGSLHSSASTPLTIGAWTGDGGGYSTSSIDDVAIWDQPLSTAQIQALANKTNTPLDFADPETAVYYAGTGQVTGIPDPRHTQVPLGPTTYYFRTTFEFTGATNNQALLMSAALDDGAVFWLNGTEVYRQNMPSGEVFYATVAETMVDTAAYQEGISLATSALVQGTNVLAVEVHQTAAGGDTDMVFGAELTLEEIPLDPALLMPATVVLNEVAGAGDGVFSFELVNRGMVAVELGGFVLATTFDAEYILPAQTLAPGGFLSLDASQLGFAAAAGDRVFLLNPARTRVEDGVEIKPTRRGRWPNGTGEWLYPDGATPGAANVVTLRDEIVINEIMYHHRPGYPTPDIPPTYNFTTLVPIDATWKYNRMGQNLGATWHQMNHVVDGTNWQSGQALLGVEPDTIPEPVRTTWTFDPTIITYYFQIEFAVTAALTGAQLRMRHIIDDGAVFYLNGVELTRAPSGSTRFFMTAGAFTSSTQASFFVGNAVATTVELNPASLVNGNNVLSVEVHQRGNTAATSTDVVFGMELILQTPATPLIPGDPFSENPEEWIELYNRSAAPVDLSGWSFSSGIDYTFAPGVTLGAGQYLVVAKDAVGLAAKYPGITVVGDYDGTLNDQDDRVRLVDARKNPADEVHYYEGGRWPEFADGGGSSLELRDPRSDNSLPEAWAASDESGRSDWQTITYRGLAGASAFGPDGQWHEFLFGLLDAGEILLDDISVVQNPQGSPVQLIQNSTFEADALGGGASKWRIVGNHRGTVIVDPTNPVNEVLRLVATGDTEHMSNHAETTLKNGATFATITSTAEYEISLRAKWVTGSPQLNTRLYFNRLVRTTNLALPTQSGTPGGQNSRYVANAGPTYQDFGHSPAVPQALQPVTVSATAADPDGAAAMTLWYSVAGGAWTSAAMTHQGGVQYTAAIPGQPASTIVQFYVEGQDGLGAVSTFPAGGRDSRALYKVNDNLAATNGLHNFRIVMRADDAAILHDPFNLMSNGRLGATVIYDEQEIFYDVGVRLKGSEHSRVSTLRLGFNVEFHPEQLFRDTHRTVSIDRSESVFFGQREMLLHQTMNHVGGILSKYNDLIQVITPQLAHTGSAELQMARYGNDFLDSQFENGSDGILVEYELVYRITSADSMPEGRKVYTDADGALGTPIRDLGNDKEGYRWTFLLKNNADRDDYSRIIQWAKTMGLSGAAFNTQIGNVIDVDQWLRGFAFSVLSGAGDAYSAAGDAHNVQFYVRPEDNKVLHFPHDLDAFFDANRALEFGSDLPKLIGPSGNRVPGNAHMYYGHVHDMISTTYNGTYMQHWADNYGRLLPAQPFASHLAFIVQRSNKLLNDIKAPTAAGPEIPFNITTPDSTVNAAVASISGTGWVNVRTIRLAGDPNPLPVTWNTVTGWTAMVPVEFGAHPVTLEAYNFQGALVGTDTVTITSTVSVRPLQDFLRVTELMYHPADPSAAETMAGFVDADQFEFIELHNTSTDTTLNLAGVKFTVGISFDFTASGVTSIGPGEYAVVASNTAAFAVRYGTAGIAVAGAFTGQLNNAGETVRLVDPSTFTIAQFTYDDNGAGWHPTTDGEGPSLVILNELGDPAGWDLGSSWRPSFENGSPGERDMLLGDFDLNNRVELADLAFLQSRFGTASGATKLTGDLTGDGAVDRNDAMRFATRFGRFFAPPAPSRAASAAAPAAVVARSAGRASVAAMLRATALRERGRAAALDAAAVDMVVTQVERASSDASSAAGTRRPLRAYATRSSALTVRDLGPDRFGSGPSPK